MSEIDFEEMARALEANDDYRVLRRLRSRERRRVGHPPAKTLARGVVLDTETTGFDATKDKVIELGLLSFTFDSEEGVPYDIVGRYQSLEDPGFPIDPAASRVHSITDEMVKGSRIDDARVAFLLEGADIVIAHHAAFDRPFCERREGFVKDLPWACSGTQIPWAGEGIGSTKLEYLACRVGFFYDSHRAMSDCEALLEVLAHPLPVSGKTGLMHLLSAYRRKELRVWAVGAPYECKASLNARGYQWGDGTRGQERAWYRLVPEEALEAELHWLRTHVYFGAAEVIVDTVDEWSRFSERRIGTRVLALP